MHRSKIGSLREVVERSLIVSGLLIGLSENAFAHSGDLETHFGSSGTTLMLTASSIMPDARPVAVDQLNRAIFATSTLGGDFIGALKADGGADTSFGVGGMVALDEFVTALAIDSHNRIVVVQRDGSFTATTTEISRFLPDGSPDPSFGAGGVMTIDGSPYYLTGQAIAIDRNDNLIVAGNAQPISTSDSYLFAAKLDTTGSMDATFGSGGKTIILSGGDGLASSNGAAVAVDATGNVFLAGYSQIDATHGIADVVKLTNAGALDSSFATDGVAQIDAAPGEPTPHGTSAASVALDAAGNVVITGVVGNWSGVSAPVLARLLPNGNIDPAFGAGVPEILPVESDLQGQGETVMIDGRDRIVLTGITQNADGYTHFVAMRFNDDGYPDTTFGSGSGYRLLTDAVWGGRSTFMHGGDILIFGNTYDCTAIIASELIGYDLPPVLPPSGF